MKNPYSWIRTNKIPLTSKIEKVPRGIQGEKSSKDIEIWSQQYEHK